MDMDFFDEGQLQDLIYYDFAEEEDSQVVYLEGIDMAKWEKKKGL